MSPSESLPDAHRDDARDGDFLELDHPDRTHRTFGRLGFLVLGTGVGLFVISFVLTSMFAGSLLDLVVLMLWLGAACLAVAGLALLGLAGVRALMRKAPV